jgi:hypothetical protein
MKSDNRLLSQLRAEEGRFNNGRHARAEPYKRPKNSRLELIDEEDDYDEEIDVQRRLEDNCY